MLILKTHETVNPQLGAATEWVQPQTKPNETHRIGLKTVFHVTLL